MYPRPTCKWLWWHECIILTNACQAFRSRALLCEYSLCALAKNTHVRYTKIMVMTWVHGRPASRGCRRTSTVCAQPFLRLWSGRHRRTWWRACADGGLWTLEKWRQWPLCARVRGLTWRLIYHKHIHMYIWIHTYIYSYVYIYMYFFWNSLTVRAGTWPFLTIDMSYVYIHIFLSRNSANSVYVCGYASFLACVLCKSLRCHQRISRRSQDQISPRGKVSILGSFAQNHQFSEFNQIMSRETQSSRQMDTFHE